MSSKTRAEKKKKQSWEPPSVTPALPEDVIVDILARVPRYDYPTLSLVSKHFRSLVASPELYARRSLFVCTEHCLYVVLYNRDTEDDRLYILRRKANGNSRLVLIPSLPDLAYVESFVAVGSKIYVFGGGKYHNRTTRALTIDCRSHTVQPLPSVPVPMADTIADIINERIYVIRNYYDKGKGKLMVAFNTGTQKWEEVGMIKADIKMGSTWRGCVVMADKMYIRDDDNSFVYEPKKSKWETDDMLNLKDWKHGCVVDDLLYYYDYAVKNIRTYDPKQRCWGVVKGVEEWLAKTKGYPYIDIDNVSYCGKLALFFSNGKRKLGEIWCAEISLERRQGREIWGKVEWCDHILG